MVNEYISNMVLLLQTKKDLLGEILSISKEQTGHIEKEDMEEMEGLLLRKDDLMAKIDKLDEDFLNYYSKVLDQEGLGSISELDPKKYLMLKDLKSNVEKINLVLDEISFIDRENTKKMRKNLEDIKSSLKHVKDVKKAYKGYNYVPEASMLIDEKK